MAERPGIAERPRITVEATGLASAPPDVARVNLVTFTTDPSPADALTGCTLLTERVLAAVRAAGVAEGDIETTAISLNQWWQEPKDRSGPAYRAESQLLVTVRPPGEAGRVVAAAVEAAGDGVGVNGVNFDLDDRLPLVARARRVAVERALEAAAELADAAGLSLGRLVELSEGGPPLAHRAGRFLAVAASAPPIQPGDRTVSVVVTAVFEAAPA